MENQNTQNLTPTNQDETPVVVSNPKSNLLGNLKNFSLRKFSSVFIVVIMALVSLLMVGLLLNKRNISLKPGENTGAANPSCYVELTRKTPSPSPTPSPTPLITVSPSPKITPKPTSTPVASSGVCDITFIPSEHQAVCWKEPRTVTVTYKVNSLPTNGVYYMQTDWYIATPFQGNHYDESTRIYAGQTYTFTAQWPGIPSPTPEVVEIHAGLNVVDANHNLLTPNCSKGLDYFWTPYVSCPNLSTPTPKPTTKPVTCSWWDKIRGKCK